MTDSLFFDNDCLSAFLWVGNENLLVKLYPGRVCIPKQVYDELSVPGISHLKAKVDTLLANNQVSLVEIMVGTEIFDLYYQLTEKPEAGHVIIGKGEAASIAIFSNIKPLDFHVKKMLLFFNYNYIILLLYKNILTIGLLRGRARQIDRQNLSSDWPIAEQPWPIRR